MSVAQHATGFRMLAALLLVFATIPGSTARAAPANAPSPYVADGRATLAGLRERYDSLRERGSWITENVYRYPDDPRLSIDAWRTKGEGPALWILAGIHGEEPAGPNALAEAIDSIAALAKAGIPIVMVPMCNPRAYWNNWRYPATPDRNWQGGGYSVGDSEYLLPKVAGGTGQRAARAPGPETAALTQYALTMTERYPPVLVLDFHEDELSTEGGYVYWQGRSGAGPKVAREIVRLLQSAGVTIRTSGKTRFDETIEDGIIGPNGVGQLFNDGSIDELLAAPEVIVAGQRRPKPAAPVAIVIETPAMPGSKLAARVAGHRAVIGKIQPLWVMSGGATAATAATAAASPLRVVAGDVEAGFRDGTGAAARFREPIRLAAFDDDSILVADIFNHAIRKVSRDGKVTTIAGRPQPGHRDGPADQALFDSPHGVAVSGAGVIAVGEATNNTVRLITPVRASPGKQPGYEISTLAGTPGSSGMRDGPAAQALFASPHAVAWQSDGSLLVLDIGNARIRRIADGIVTTVAGGDRRGRADGPPLSASFIAPIDFTIAPDHAVYIADAGTGRIARWTTAEGVRSLTVNAGLDKPHGVAVGPDGLVFVAEIGAHRVVAISADGAVTRIAGTGIAGDGPQQLNRPAAVLLHAGLLWVADLGNNRILAGTPGQTDSAAGKTGT